MKWLFGAMLSLAVAIYAMSRNLGRHKVQDEQAGDEDTPAPELTPGPEIEAAAPPPDKVRRPAAPRRER